MVKCVQSDPRLATAHEVDIIVRKDGRERRLEADWIKVLGRMYRTKETSDDVSYPPPMVVTRSSSTDLRTTQNRGQIRR